MCVQLGHVACIEELLLAGAAIEAGDFQMLTPLHYAAHFNHPGIGAELITRKAYELDALPDAAHREEEHSPIV